ncbi:hypothetical protein J6590_039325 [Homalodisca vitripennis]|nr:hypothetical protein J6590_039325 [Homalodisca vitripennis]
MESGDVGAMEVICVILFAGKGQYNDTVAWSRPDGCQTIIKEPRLSPSIRSRLIDAFIPRPLCHCLLFPSRWGILFLQNSARPVCSFRCKLEFPLHSPREPL